MDLTDWISEAARGPLHLRLVLQPLVAIVLAVRDGLRDARLGDEPFLYRLLLRRTEARTLLRSAWSTLMVPLVVAFVLDSVAQVLILGSYRPLASVLVGGLLVGLPYSVVRGIACRAGRTARRHRRPA